MHKAQKFRTISIMFILMVTLIPSDPNSNTLFDNLLSNQNLQNASAAGTLVISSSDNSPDTGQTITLTASVQSWSGLQGKTMKLGFSVGASDICSVVVNTGSETCQGSGGNNGGSAGSDTFYLALLGSTAITRTITWTTAAHAPTVTDEAAVSAEYGDSGTFAITWNMADVDGNIDEFFVDDGTADGNSNYVYSTSSDFYDLGASGSSDTMVTTWNKNAYMGTRYYRGRVYDTGNLYDTSTVTSVTIDDTTNPTFATQPSGTSIAYESGDTSTRSYSYTIDDPLRTAGLVDYIPVYQRFCGSEGYAANDPLSGGYIDCSANAWTGTDDQQYRTVKALYDQADNAAKSIDFGDLIFYDTTGLVIQGADNSLDYNRYAFRVHARDDQNNILESSNWHYINVYRGYAPILDTPLPGDHGFEQGTTTTENIAWSWVENIDPNGGTYTIARSATESGTYTNEIDYTNNGFASGSGSVSYDVSDFTSSSNNWVRITVVDTLGNSVTDKVHVSVTAAGAPSFSVIASDTVYEETDSTVPDLSWTFSDAYLGTNYYVRKTSNTGSSYDCDDTDWPNWGSDITSGSYTTGNKVVAQTITGLSASANPTSYRYCIRVEDTTSTNSYDVATVDVYNDEIPTLPSAPSDITYEATASGSHDITWTISDNAPIQGTYIIEKKTNVGGTYSQISSGTWIDSGSDDTVIWDASGESVANDYYYRITVTDSTTTNIASDEIVVTVEPNTAPSIDSPSDLSLEGHSTNNYLEAWYPFNQGGTDKSGNGLDIGVNIMDESQWSAYGTGTTANYDQVTNIWTIVTDGSSGTKGLSAPASTAFMQPGQFMTISYYIMVSTGSYDLYWDQNEYGVDYSVAGNDWTDRTYPTPWLTTTTWDRKEIRLHLSELQDQAFDIRGTIYVADSTAHTFYVKDIQYEITNTWDEPASPYMGYHADNGLFGGAEGYPYTLGRMGDALVINGRTNNEYIKIPTAAMQGITDFTIATWIYFNSIDDIQPIISVSDSGQHNALLIYARSTSLVVSLNGVETSIGTTFTTGSWYHIAFSRVGNDGFVYINGVLTGSVFTVETNTIDADSIIIGQEQDALEGSFSTSQALEGYLDDFRIYSCGIAQDTAYDMFYQIYQDKVQWTVSDTTAGQLFITYSTVSAVDSQNYASVAVGAMHHYSAFTSGSISMHYGDISETTWFTLTFVDGTGLISQDTVKITITAPTIPLINNPSDFSYESGDTTARNIEWIFSDNIEGSSYLLLASTDNVVWNVAGNVVTYTWSGVSGSATFNFGSYTQTYYWKIQVWDEAGNMVEDVILVTVTAATDPIFTSTPNDISYETSIGAGDLIAWYPLDGTGQDIKSSFDMTAYGTRTTEIGVMDRGIKLIGDGSSYINRALTTEFDNINEFTISIWMQYLDTPGNWHDIFRIWDSSVAHYTAAIIMDVDSIYGYFNDGVNDVIVNLPLSGLTTLDTDQAWHNLVLRNDGTNLALFIDGIEVLSTSHSSTPDQTPNMIIIGDTSFDAVYDDARVYNSALPDEVIVDLVEQGTNYNLVWDYSDEFAGSTWALSENSVAGCSGTTILTGTWTTPDSLTFGAGGLVTDTYFCLSITDTAGHTVTDEVFVDIIGTSTPTTNYAGDYSISYELDDVYPYRDMGYDLYDGLDGSYWLFEKSIDGGTTWTFEYDASWGGVESGYLGTWNGDSHTVSTIYRMSIWDQAGNKLEETFTINVISREAPSILSDNMIPLVSDGLVGHWTFDSTTADSAGSNDGTLNNGATYGSGLLGDASLSVGGSTGAASGAPQMLVDASEFTEIDFTFMVWVKFDAYECDVVAKTDEWFEIYRCVGGDGNILTYRSEDSGGSNQNTPGTTPIWNGIWYHVAISSDGATKNMYINGELDVTAATTVTITSLVGRNLSFGSYPNTNYGMEGNLDDGRVYNRVLTANEVKAIYEGDFTDQQATVGLNNANDDLLVHYTFNNHLLDISGNNNHLVGGTSDSFISGVHRRSVSFNNNYLEIPVENLRQNDITISAWANSNDFNGGGFFGLYTDIGTNDLDGFWFHLYPTYMALRTEDVTNGETGWIISDLVFDTNTWYYFTFIIRLNQVLTYLNGVLIDTHNHNFSMLDLDPTNTLTLYIGRPYYSGYYFNGMVDDFRIYTSVLSQDEITAIYNNDLFFQVANYEAMGADPSQIAYYNFDGNTNNTFVSKNLYGNPLNIVYFSAENHIQYSAVNSPIHLPANNIDYVLEINDGLSYGTWSGSDWWGYYQKQFKPSVSDIGATYTMSMYVYVTLESTDLISAYMDTTIGSVRQSLTDAQYDLTKKGTWQRLTRTGVMDVQKLTEFIYVRSTEGVGFDGAVYVAGIQIEKNSIVTDYEPSYGVEFMDEPTNPAGYTQYNADRYTNDIYGDSNNALADYGFYYNNGGTITKYWDGSISGYSGDPSPNTPLIELDKTGSGSQWHGTWDSNYIPNVLPSERYYYEFWYKSSFLTLSYLHVKMLNTAWGVLSNVPLINLVADNSWHQVTGYLTILDDFASYEGVRFLIDWDYSSDVQELLMSGITLKRENNLIYESGVNGAAGLFNGIDDYVFIDDDLNGFDDESFSVSMWVNTVTSTNYYETFMMSESSGYLYGWALRENHEGHFQIAIADASTGSWNGVTDPVAFTNGIWYHLTATWDAISKTVSLYVDGSSIGAYTFSSTMTRQPSDQGFTFGKYVAVDRWFNGNMDEVKLFAKTLTASEVNAIYSAVNPTITWFISDNVELGDYNVYYSSDINDVCSSGNIIFGGNLKNLVDSQITLGVGNLIETGYYCLAVEDYTDVHISYDILYVNAYGETSSGLLTTVYDWGGLDKSADPLDKGPQVYQTIEPTINFVNYNPTGILTDYYGITAEGWIQAQYTETYTFSISANDGARVWINNTKVYDHWRGLTNVPYTLDLTADEWYPIYIQSYELTDAQVLSLSWSSVSQSLEIVPSLYLKPSDNVPATEIILEKDGLVASWDFDNVDDSKSDSTGNGYTLTNTNTSVVWDTDQHSYVADFGSYKNEMEINAFSDEIMDLDAETSWTISAKVKPRGAPVDGSHGFILTRAGWHQGIIQLSNTFTVYIGDMGVDGISGGDYTTRTIVYVIPDYNVWYDLDLIYDNHRISFYVDNVLVGVDFVENSGSELHDRAQIFLGGWLYGGVYHTFNGAIDEVKIYDRAIHENTRVNTNDIEYIFGDINAKNMNFLASDVIGLSNYLLDYSTDGVIWTLVESGTLTDQFQKVVYNANQGEIFGEYYYRFTTHDTQGYTRQSFVSVTVLGNNILQSPTLPDPILYMPFDDNVVDLVQGNDGTWTGTETYRKGIDANSAEFDISSKITAPNPILDNDFSASVWFKSDAVTGQEGLVGTGDWTDTFAIYLRHAAGGDIGVSFTMLNGTRYNIATGVVDYSRWNHIVTFFDTDGNLGLYLNGEYVYVGGGTLSTVSRENDDVTIGYGNVGAPQYFEGGIDEFMIFDEALSPSQIKDLYQRNYRKDDGLFMPAPVGFYPLDHDAKDHSGNQNDGTWSGTPLYSSTSGGVIGSAGSFDNSYITLSNPTYQFTGSFTASMWVRFDVLPTTKVGFIGNADYLDGGFQFSYQGDNGNFALLIGGDGVGDLRYGLSPVINRYYNLIYSYDVITETGEFFIDGVKQGDSLVEKMTVNDKLFYIGRGSQGGWTDNFDGRIDEVLLYDQKLSASQIQYVYDRGYADVELEDSSLVAHYEFEGDATDSGGSADGTWYGTEAYVKGKIGFSAKITSESYINAPVTLTGDVLTVSTWAMFTKNEDLGAFANSLVHEISPDSYNWNLGEEWGDINWVVDSSTSVLINSRYEGSTNSLDQFLNSWHHYTGVLDGQYARFYIDGRLISEIIIPDNAKTLATTAIQIGGGNGGDTSLYFSGLIDDLRIYNIALSSLGVETLYSVGSELIAEFHFDDSLKDTANGFDGILTGNEIYTSGHEGTAFELNGDITNYITLDNKILDGVTDFSISAWVYSDDWDRGGVGFNTFISGASSVASNELTSFITGSTIQFYIGDEGDSWTYTFNDDTEYHIAVTRQNDILSMYVNGVPLGVRSTLFTPLNIETLMVGQEQDSVGGGFDPNQSFRGWIDNLYFYKGVLTDNKIKHIASDVNDVEYYNPQRSGYIYVNSPDSVYPDYYTIEHQVDRGGFSYLYGYDVGSAALWNNNSILSINIASLMSDISTGTVHEFRVMFYDDAGNSVEKTVIKHISPLMRANGFSYRPFSYAPNGVYYLEQGDLIGVVGRPERFLDYNQYDNVGGETDDINTVYTLDYQKDGGLWTYIDNYSVANYVRFIKSGYDVLLHSIPNYWYGDAPTFYWSEVNFPFLSEVGTFIIRIKGYDSMGHLTIDTYTLEIIDKQSPSIMSVGTDQDSTLVAHYTLNGDSTNGVYDGLDGVDTDIVYDDSFLGQSAEFDGLTSKINLGDTIPDARADVSVALWVNLASLSSTGIIFDRYWAEKGYGIAYDGPNNMLEVRVGNDIDFDYKVQLGIPTISTWYHIVLTWDFSTEILSGYLNGVFIDDIQAAGTFTYDVPNAHLGARFGSTSFFDGEIDDVRVYSTIIPQNTISMLYADSVGFEGKIHKIINTQTPVNTILNETSIVRHYALDGDVTDSVNGEDGTNTGSFGDGFLGQSADLTGSNYLVTMPVFEMDIGSSLNLWMKIETLPTPIGIVRGLLTSYDQVVSLGTTVDIQDDDGFGYYIPRTFGNTHFLDTWSMITLVMTDVGWDFYVNGTLDGTLNVRRYHKLSLAYFGRGYASNVLDGFIDEITVWDSALDADGVQTLFDDYMLDSQELLYYPMDAIDETSHGITRTYSPSAPIVEDGILDNALNYEGDRYGYINTNVPQIQNSDFSVSMWAKFNNFEFEHALFGANTDWVNYLMMRITPSKTLQIYVGNGLTSSPLPLDAGVWYHFGFTYDQSTTTGNFYFNGELIFTRSDFTGYPSTISTMFIGAASAGWSETDGALDEFYLYSYPISDNSMVALYSAGITHKTNTQYESVVVDLPLQSNIIDFSSYETFSSNLATEYTYSPIGNALEFTTDGTDGGSQYLVANTAWQDQTWDQLSISVWFRMDSYSEVTDSFAIVGNWEYFSGKGFTLRNAYAADDLQFVYGDGVGAPSSYNTIGGISGKIELNQWQHIAIEFNQNTGEFTSYWNGVLYKTSIITRDLVMNADLYVGKSMVNTGYLDGAIAGLEISNSVLGHDLIKAKSNAPIMWSITDNFKVQSWDIRIGTDIGTVCSEPVIQSGDFTGLETYIRYDYSELTVDTYVCLTVVDQGNSHMSDIVFIEVETLTYMINDGLVQGDRSFVDYADAPLIYGHYDMSNGMDMSGNNNDGTVYGDYYTSDGVVGNSLIVEDDAYYLQSLNIPHDSLLDYTGGTLSFIINYKRHIDDDGGFLISKPWNGAGDYNYQIQVLSTGRIHLRFAGDVATIFDTNYDLPLDQWTQIGMVLNNNLAYLYIDGTLVYSVDIMSVLSNWIPDPVSDNLKLAIGTLYPYGSKTGHVTSFTLNGEYSDLRIYNSALDYKSIKEYWVEKNAYIYHQFSSPSQYAIYNSSDNSDWDLLTNGFGRVAYFDGLSEINDMYYRVIYTDLFGVTSIETVLLGVGAYVSFPNFYLDRYFYTGALMSVSEEIVIPWSATDSSDGTYNIYRNGIIIQTGTWASSVMNYLYVSDGLLANGIYNFTLEIVGSEIFYFNFDLLDSAPFIYYASADVEVEIGHSIELLWAGADDFPDYYTITLDTNIVTTTMWTESAVSYILPTDLSLGVHDITLTVYDMLGGFDTHTIEVTIGADLTDPVVQLDTPFNSYASGTGLLYWSVFDATAGTYAVFKDGIPFTNGVWTTNAQISVDISGVAVGYYNFSVVFTDSAGNTGSSFTELAIRVDSTSPIIIFGLIDYSYIFDTTGNILRFAAIDDHTDVYSVTIGGDSYDSGSWSNSAYIDINIDGLAIGVHTLILSVYDTNGQLAIITTTIAVA